MLKLSFGFWLLSALLAFWGITLLVVGPPTSFTHMTPVSVSLGAAAAAYFSRQQVRVAQLQFKETFLDRRIEIIEPLAELRSQIKVDHFVDDALFKTVLKNHTRVSIIFPEAIAIEYTKWQNIVRNSIKDSKKDFIEGRLIHRLREDVSKNVMASGLALVTLMLVESGVRPDSEYF